MNQPFVNIDSAEGDRVVAPRGPYRQLSPTDRIASLKATRAVGPPDDAIWVFGYASLMWRPCFQAVERREALLEGYARRCCIWTSLARGTPTRPGLALGLEAAADSCRGVAFRLDPSQLDTALEALWEREMVTGIYEPHWLEMTTETGLITALAFVVDPSHRQYAGELPRAAAATVIAGAHGKFGSCRDYLASTVESLQDSGHPDPELEALLDAVQALP